MKRKRIFSILLAFVLIFSLATTVAASQGKSNIAFDQGVISQISISRMMEDVRYLSEGIGVRIASSPEETLAAEYIARAFEKYGYEAEIQEFPYQNRVAYVTMVGPEVRKIDVRIGGTRTNAPLTDSEGITGRIIECGYGGTGDFPEEVAGNIALVRRGQETFQNMYNRARSAGATALLIQNSDWTIFSASVTGATIPYATLNYDTGELLRGDDIVVNYKAFQYDTSRNVIATRKPNNKNRNTGNVVVFSAHYDSVPTAPGANDNASGTAGLLELARIFSSKPIDTEIRFLACGAEEVGLVGSRYYVSQLTPEERGSIIANYNMDMIATAGPDQSTLYINTLDGDNLVSRSAREAAERLGYGHLVRAPFHRGSSDHQAFFEGGIEAGNFIWRDPVTAALEPWYHQPYDTMEYMSEARFKIAMEIVAAASYSVIRVDTPNLEPKNKDKVKPIKYIEFETEDNTDIPEM